MMLWRRTGPRRALLALTSFDPSMGGIASVNRNVVRALQTLSADSSNWKTRAVLLHDPAAPALPAEYRERRPVQTIGCTSRRWRFLWHFLASCLSGWTDFVFVGHLHLAVVAYLCRWLLPHGYVLICYGIEFDQPLSWLRRAAFRRARLRLGISEFTAKRLMEKFPGVVVEPCLLGLDEFALPPPRPGPFKELEDAFGSLRPLQDRVVLMVGRTSASERYKGHDQMISVMPALLRSCPVAQLVITGSGDDLDRLKAQARDGGAGHAILFSGFVSPEDLSSLYARCRLFALPSRGEGFGLVYLEAMRFAKPCLASNADGGREVVADGVTGLLVDPANLTQIQLAVERLLTDDELNRRMGQAGLERLNERFRFAHFRERLRNHLAKVLPGLASASITE